MKRILMIVIAAMAMTATKAQNTLEIMYDDGVTVAYKFSKQFKFANALSMEAATQYFDGQSIEMELPMLNVDGEGIKFSIFVGQYCWSVKDKQGKVIVQGEEVPKEASIHFLT